MSKHWVKKVLEQMLSGFTYVYGSGDGARKIAIKEAEQAILAKIDSIKRDTVADFIQYAHKKGYIDADWYTEEPFLFDEYFKDRKELL